MRNLDFKNITYKQLLEFLRDDFKDKQIRFDFNYNRLVSHITKSDSFSLIPIHCYVMGNSVGVIYVIDNIKKSNTYGDIKYICKSYEELFNAIQKDYDEFINKLSD